MPSQIILVTGANRGIGFSIIQATAPRNSTATYLLGCRSIAAGEDAIKELRTLGIESKLDVVELDITNDDSIVAAAEYVKTKYGHLDVLVNNAGIALIPKSDSLSELRSNFSTTFNTNIISVHATTQTFLPLLRASPLPNPKIINVSSSRGSLALSAAGKMPPTVAVAYSVSKAALNRLTIETQNSEELREGGGKVECFAVNPGHCKTAFNRYRGKKDPLDGAEVVVRLIIADKGVWKKGVFWEFEEGVMREVLW